MVGVGIAGLSAARILLNSGLDVVMLEGSERVGGRTHNRRLSDGALVNLEARGSVQATVTCANWRTSTDCGGRLLWARREPVGKHTVPRRGRVHRRAAIRQRCLGSRAVRRSRRLDSLAHRIDVCPWAATDAEQLDEKTYGERPTEPSAMPRRELC